MTTKGCEPKLSKHMGEEKMKRYTNVVETVEDTIQDRTCGMSGNLDKVWIGSGYEKEERKRYM